MVSDALQLVESWPVDHAAAALVTTSPGITSFGEQERRFALASLTKPMTAWAALVAVEEGIVHLDDPVGQPGCTLRHLLAHAGGYPFEGDEPVSAPQRTRIYSNTGFEMLATHVEAAAEIGFADYLTAAVFQPLGMSSTTLDGSPASGATSTCADVGRFLAEMAAPTLLHSSTVADAIEPQYPALAGIVPGVGRYSPCPWGLGVEIAGDKAPHWMGRQRSPRTYGHFGGAGTMMWVDPDARCALVALTDRPFDQWAGQAVASWMELSDEVIRQVQRTPTPYAPAPDPAEPERP